MKNTSMRTTVFPLLPLLLLAMPAVADIEPAVVYELTDKSIVCLEAKHVHRVRAYTESGDRILIQDLIERGVCIRYPNGYPRLRHIRRLTPNITGLSV